MDGQNINVTSGPFVNVNPRIRTTVNACGNCRNYNGPGLDEPDDPAFCLIDGCSIHTLQTCKDWQNDA